MLQERVEELEGAAASSASSPETESELQKLRDELQAALARVSEVDGSLAAVTQERDIFRTR